jgi:hypothetical protein
MPDASTPDDGALRLVPGSHRRGQLPQQALADPLADHPGQVLVTGRADTVVVPIAHAWHTGTAHRAGRPRAALHAFSGRRDRPRQQDQKRLLRPGVQLPAAPVAGAARPGRPAQRPAPRHGGRPQRVPEVTSTLA